MRTFELSVILQSSTLYCVAAVLVSGLAASDLTICEKLNSGFCSSCFRASRYVKFFVIFNRMIYFSFFHVSHSFDRDRCAPPQLTHFVGFLQ